MKFSAPLAVLTDGDEHARLRKQVQPGFSKGAMDSWQGMTEKLAVELVSDMLTRGECDVVQHLAIPMPIRMIAQILGIPECDVDDFRRWSEDAVRLMDFTPRGVAWPEQRSPCRRCSPPAASLYEADCSP